MQVDMTAMRFLVLPVAASAEQTPSALLSLRKAKLFG